MWNILFILLLRPVCEVFMSFLVWSQFVAGRRARELPGPPGGGSPQRRGWQKGASGQTALLNRLQLFRKPSQCKLCNSPSRERTDFDFEVVRKCSKSLGIVRKRLVANSEMHFPNNSEVEIRSFSIRESTTKHRIISRVCSADGGNHPGIGVDWHGHVRHERPLREGLSAPRQEEEARDESTSQDTQSAIQRKFPIQRPFSFWKFQP